MKKGGTANLFIAAALLGCVALAGGAPAFAANGDVAGCDSGGGASQKVLDVMNTKPNTVVAYRVAGSENYVHKNDSVVFMTCLNSAVGNASKNLGEIFSGDYTAGLQKTIDDALPSFANDFALSIGSENNWVDYTKTAMDTNMATCPATSDLWKNYRTMPIEPTLTKSNIKLNVPFATYEDFYTGNMPASGPTGAADANSNFAKDWNVSNGTDNDFTNFKNAVAALPKTDMTLKADGTGGAGPSTATLDRTCDLMFNYGLAASATCP